MAIAGNAPERSFGMFIPASPSKTMLPSPPLPMMAVRMAANLIPATIGRVGAREADHAGDLPAGAIP
jgi:hypothetical protein